MKNKSKAVTLTCTATSTCTATTNFCAILFTFYLVCSLNKENIRNTFRTIVNFSHDKLTISNIKLESCEDGRNNILNNFSLLSVMVNKQIFVDAAKSRGRRISQTHRAFFVSMVRVTSLVVPRWRSSISRVRTIGTRKHVIHDCWNKALLACMWDIQNRML